jgi:hypothetical protein
VNYSLIYRNPEENGVKAACDELGVTLIAYSPIAQGREPRAEFLLPRVCCFLFAAMMKYHYHMRVLSWVLVCIVSIEFVGAGALTGKYTPESPPKGPRGRIYTPEFLTKVAYICDSFMVVCSFLDTSLLSTH